MFRSHHTLAAVLALAALAASASAAPVPGRPRDAATQPAPGGQPPGKEGANPSTRRSDSSRESRLSWNDRSARLKELTRQSIEHLQKKELDAAEPLLLEAIRLAPHDATTRYNYACLLALQGKVEAGVDALVRAADDGFVDFAQVVRDPDLTNLRSNDRYRQFVAHKDDYQRKAAQQVIDQLRRRFGDDYLYELDGPNKLIFAAKVDGPTLAEVKQWLQRQANSQWKTLFSHRPDGFISVVVPSEADYRKIVPSKEIGGFYSDSAKLLICRRLGQVVTHEFTHALHAADMAAEGQEHPIWLTEGLATMYEAATFSGDELVPADNFRLAVLQRAARRKKLLPLDQLLTLRQEAFVEKADLAYGQSGSLLLYLHEKGLLRRFYDAYKAGFADDSTGRRALESVTGRPLAGLESDWRAWMVARPPLPWTTGDDGVVIGASFLEVSDGLRVDSVLPAGPAARSGIEPGDVLVGVNATSIRDYASLLPLLAHFKPGDEVTLKFRRGQTYLEQTLVLERRADVLERAAKAR